MPHLGSVKAFIKLFSVNPFPQMTWKICHQFVRVAQDYQGCVLSGFRVQDHFADRLPSEQGQGGMTRLLGPRKGLLGISFPSSHPYDVITTKIAKWIPAPDKGQNLQYLSDKWKTHPKFKIRRLFNPAHCNMQGYFCCIIAICSSMITSSEERSTSSVPMSCYLLIKNLFFLSNTKNILSDIEV